jgi:hypothetical protein
VTHSAGASAGRIVERHYQRAGSSLLAGLVVGSSASAIFAVLLSVPAATALFPFVRLPGWALIPIAAVPTLLLGVAFALLVTHARQERAVWWRLLLVGASLPVAGTVGLEFAAHLEPLGTSRSDLILPVFRLAFTTASALVAAICMCVATWVFRVDGAARRTIEVATITPIAYFIVAIALDMAPGFHVGGGDRAMPKVALLCNLIAGFTGGAAAFRSLTRR